MASSTSEVTELILKAIEAEKNGLRVYLKFARETKEISGKDLFILLANDEYDHMVILEKMVKNIIEEKGESTIPVNLDLSVIEKILPKLRKKDRLTKGAAGADELTALKTALDMERNSIEYYQRLYESLDKKELRNIAHRLVELEEGHYDIIQMQMDSVTNTGFWFDTQEFSLEM